MSNRSFYPKEVERMIDGESNSLPTVADFRRMVVLTDSSNLLLSYIITGARVIFREASDVYRRPVSVFLPPELDEYIIAAVDRESQHHPEWLWYNGYTEGGIADLSGDLLFPMQTPYLSTPIPMILTQLWAYRDAQDIDAGRVSEDEANQRETLVLDMLTRSMNEVDRMMSWTNVGRSPCQVLDQWDALTYMTHKNGCISRKDIYKYHTRILARLVVWMEACNMAPSRHWGELTISNIKAFLTDLGNEAIARRSARLKQQRGARASQPLVEKTNSTNG